MTHSLPGDGELLPLATEFDVTWRGYRRSQVDEYIRTLEADRRMALEDRDAAMSLVESLTEQLASAQDTIDELSAKLDRVCLAPLGPEGQDERLRRRLELTQDQANEILARAKAAAEYGWALADQASHRWRSRLEQLTKQLDRQRQEVEAEHRTMLEQGRKAAELMTRQAQERQRELDEQAARRRKQMQDDFELALAARRAETQRALAEQEAAGRAEAERLRREAAEEARRRIDEAEQRVEELRQVRHRLIDQLRGVNQQLSHAETIINHTESGAEAGPELGADSGTGGRRIPASRLPSAIEQA